MSPDAHADVVASTETLTARARHVARTVAPEHAPRVDRDARFPRESIDALAVAGVLAAAAPTRLGGHGAGPAELAQVASALARGCGATAMVWAMHQIQLACVTRHAAEGDEVSAVLHACVLQDGVVGSATSEAGIGGALRTSSAALEPGSAARSVRLEKHASTISYGREAAAVLVTARRDVESRPNDQVAVLVRADQMSLEPTSTWDSLGMRGTCSPGFRLVAEVPLGQVVAAPFHEIASETMVPLSHVLWSAVWFGLAQEAFARAARLVKSRHVSSGATAPTALAEAHWRVEVAGAQLESVATAVELHWRSGRPFTTTHVAELNALKIAASETAVAVTQTALRICGLAGYAEQGESSVARLVRDALSAPLMISNDRLLATNAALAMMVRDTGGSPEPASTEVH